MFCDAPVDWFVTARFWLKTALLLPSTFMLDDTPVAALGLTYCCGFVCDAWLPDTRLRAFARAFARSLARGTFMPCVLFVFCDAVVDWFVVARLSLNTEL